MATQLKTISWQQQKTVLSLDRQTGAPFCRLELPRRTTIERDYSEVFAHFAADSGALCLRLDEEVADETESSCAATVPHDEEKGADAQHNERRTLPAKKIGYKVKKSSSLLRRHPPPPPKMTTISANKVTELTMKFNDIIKQNNTILEEPKFRKLVKRVNSQLASGDGVLHHKAAAAAIVKIRDYNVKVTRKPSVKIKPVFTIEERGLIHVKSKPTLVRRISSKAGGGHARPEAPPSVEGVPARPTSLALGPAAPARPLLTSSPTGGAVRAAIEIFERRNSTSPTSSSSGSPRPKVPDKTAVLRALARGQLSKAGAATTKTEIGNEAAHIVEAPPQLPQRRCDSMYETLNSKRMPPLLKFSKSEEVICATIQPNTSFLWRQNQNRSPSSVKLITVTTPSPELPHFDAIVAAKELSPVRPPKKPYEDEKIYEELSKDEDNVSHNYECCGDEKYEEIRPKTDDGYEYCASPKENIYETLPAPPLLPRRQQQEPLPPRPPSRNNYSLTHEDVSNCYESIYNPDSKKGDPDNNYESIYDCQIRSNASNRDSLMSFDQHSNSLYGRSSLFNWGDENSHYNGKATSDLSSSDRSDDWIDVSDNDDFEHNSGFIIVREKQKIKKTPGWSQQCREQWTKRTKKTMDEQGIDSDCNHHYESLSETTKNDEIHDDDYDSFDSDTESDDSFDKTDENNSDIGNNQLPEPPNNQTYVLTRLAAQAGKQMRKLRRNWSLTKNDISKSLSRMTRRKSRMGLEVATNGKDQGKVEADVSLAAKSYQNMDFKTNVDGEEKAKSLPRKGFLKKFRQSMSMNAETASELTAALGNKGKSTFYLTEDINIDQEPEPDSNQDSGVSLSPVQRTSPKAHVIRPQSPPPPAPLELPKTKKDKRATSWYAEVGLFKSVELPKRPNTFWYAEVGLYQPGGSTPSTSSAENSGNTNNFSLKKQIETHTNPEISEEYYNLRNGGSDYYNASDSSFSSAEIKGNNDQGDGHLRLQDEPLYQFYDAAVLESACQDGTNSDFDSDGYEEVGGKRDCETRLSTRPTAMELVLPKNSVSFTRTLWCEIPEVIQSCVLSTLNPTQKKLQEAKFEIITSEASYLNSLNVLNNHFINNLLNLDVITVDEKQTLFGNIDSVKQCSEMLLSDMDKCWQDNILLHGICDIVKGHAEQSFDVYILYCENQILLDDTLKKIKERSGFADALKKLESSSACQSLTLYSFMMLPMQRITRWPLLIDAVLKRLSPQDTEYVTCQCALAVLNQIVSKCNEAARKKERENEMRKVSNQLEFAKGVPPIEVVTENRWLVRSGPVTQMQPRTDEAKLTFGKRFIKQPLTLFLFNDLLIVTKMKSENVFSVIHYCPRNLIELTSTDTLVSLPIKDTQGRHLLFLTILENQFEKTVEFLLSCNTETDKERWVEALTPPKSEDPNETLYECWDCPQVTAIHNYIASQPDELALARGDTINVLRKMADGWYHGERIRDGQMGWFPANYTAEIANPHVRSRNLKQRYRLLAFSENYLKNK